MIKLKKREAFERMTRLFGDHKQWGRAECLAYGLVRGMPYHVMEKTCNDNPHATMFEYKLWQLGAWPDYEYPAATSESGRFVAIDQEHRAEAYALVEWVRKVPRVKKAAPEAA